MAPKDSDSEGSKEDGERKTPDRAPEVTGVPTHFVVIQDGSCPLPVDTADVLQISAVREGEKVGLQAASLG